MKTYIRFSGNKIKLEMNGDIGGINNVYTMNLFVNSSRKYHKSCNTISTFLTIKVYIFSFWNLQIIVDQNKIPNIIL